MHLCLYWLLMQRNVQEMIKKVRISQTRMKNGITQITESACHQELCGN